MLFCQVEHPPRTVDICVNRLKRPRPIVNGRCHARAVNDPVEFPSPIRLVDHVRGPELDEWIALQMLRRSAFVAIKLSEATILAFKLGDE